MYWIPVFVSGSLDSGFRSLVGFRIPWAVFWIPKPRIPDSWLACVASVSVWFRSKKRPWKGIFGFDRARNETRRKNKRGGGEGEGRFKERKESLLPFFPNPSPLFYLRHFFARSLTLVPHSLLLNRTETLATQARIPQATYFPRFWIPQEKYFPDTHIGRLK